MLKGCEKFSNPAKSGYNKGTIRSDIRYLVVSKDVRRHRLISISYISHGRCHGRGRGFESRRPRHSFQKSQASSVEPSARKRAPWNDPLNWHTGNVRELTVQFESYDASHGAMNSRPGPEELYQRYKIDQALVEPALKSIAVVDDVLTTGAHFKAMQRRLNETFPGVPLDRIVPSSLRF